MKRRIEITKNLWDWGYLAFVLVIWLILLIEAIAHKGEEDVILGAEGPESRQLNVRQVLNTHPVPTPH
jgi:hypothetical protein